MRDAKGATVAVVAFGTVAAVAAAALEVIAEVSNDAC